MAEAGRQRQGNAMFLYCSRKELQDRASPEGCGHKMIHGYIDIKIKANFGGKTWKIHLLNRKLVSILESKMVREGQVLGGG